MVLRSLQPRIARHVVEVPFTDFGSLVLALYDVEDGISRCLWTDSSLADAYMPPTLALPYHAAQSIERPPVSYSAIGQPCYAAQFIARPTTSYPKPRAQQTSALFVLRTQRQFPQLGYAIEPGSSEAHGGAKTRDKSLYCSETCYPGSD
ncbi:hypothetical protein CK203_096066 [Vitis vinifera]|uniref:Uncharacterized protein n=1 Tax=Vitis vinifera TaxID=29760 RepID=A0A438CGQ5_VITVI|nr:hypothetical protein CK203_096066 [Vitis vinifera]